ncbi:MAG: hypothetical protein ACYC6Y_07685, partial [Thermoguttaceae bacterium]
MKRTLFGLLLPAAALAGATALFFSGCKPPARSSSAASTESDNVLWRNELFDFAMDTLLNRTDEFYSPERQQQTINRLDQWVRLQKPMEDWKADPLIAGVAEDLKAATGQIVDLSQKISKLQQGADTAALGEIVGQLRSAGQRLQATGVRLALLDVAQMGAQMVDTADRVEKAVGGGSAAPDAAAQAVRPIFAELDTNELARRGAELELLYRRIDP